MTDLIQTPSYYYYYFVFVFQFHPFNNLAPGLHESFTWKYFFRQNGLQAKYFPLSVFVHNITERSVRISYRCSNTNQEYSPSSLLLS